MRRNLIIFLIVILIIVVFTVQNSDPIPVRFWFWDSSLPASVLLTIAFIIGAVFGILMSIPSRKKRLQKINNTENPDEMKEETKKI